MNNILRVCKYKVSTKYKVPWFTKW